MHFREKAFLKILLGAAALSFLGCGLFSKSTDQTAEVIRQSTHQKVFFATYENVWRAAHTVIRYPIASENQDTGLLETEYIKAADGFLPPDRLRPPSSGIRYKINLIFARGKTDGRESTRVTIEKKIERQKDFFSEIEPIESDGLEEKVIFYRMERELVILETLRKAGGNL